MISLAVRSAAIDVTGVKRIRPVAITNVKRPAVEDNSFLVPDFIGIKILRGRPFVKFPATHKRKPRFNRGLSFIILMR